MTFAVLNVSEDEADAVRHFCLVVLSVVARQNRYRSLVLVLLTVTTIRVDSCFV